MTDDHKRHLLWLFLAAVVVLGAGLGLRDPWPPDEPRFALVAKDMVESGDWLIPRVGGVLYPDKPPLFFWIVAVFYTLTGSISVALLLPGFFAGLAVLWLVTDLARRLWTPKAAIWCGATLLSMVQFPLQMKAGQIDGLLCLWTTLGLYGLCRHLLCGPDWRWYTIGGVAAGLGIITKGVGFLPFLVFVPYAYAVIRHWPISRVDRGGSKWALAPLALLLAVGLWLIPMLLATTGSADAELAQYRDNILFTQTVTRYADSWVHLKPPWYLFTNAIPWLWLPVSLLLPWLIPAWVKDLKSRDPAVLLLGGWILLVLLFFSLSHGKRSLYIFPAAPALALIAGHHLPQILRSVGPKWVLFGIALLLSLVIAALGAYSLIEPSFLDEWVPQRDVAQTASRAVACIGLLGLAIVAVSRVRYAAAGFAAFMAVLWIGVSVLVYPAIDDVRSGRIIVDAARHELTSGNTLAFAGWKEQLLLQWNRPAVHFGYRRNDDAESRDAASWLSADDSRRLLLPDSLINPCFDRSQVTDLGFAHRQTWYLASSRSVEFECKTNTIDTIVYYSPPGSESPDDAK